MTVDLVEESLKFMVLGMAVVFVFLTLMVYLMKLQAFIIDKFFPGKIFEINKNAFIESPKKDDNEEKARVAAIMAAVMQYRKNQLKV